MPNLDGSAWRHSGSNALVHVICFSPMTLGRGSTKYPARLATWTPAQGKLRARLLPMAHQELLKNSWHDGSHPCGSVEGREHQQDHSKGHGSSLRHSSLKSQWGMGNNQRAPTTSNTGRSTHSLPRMNHVPVRVTENLHFCPRSLQRTEKDHRHLASKFRFGCCCSRHTKTPCSIPGDAFRKVRKPAQATCLACSGDMVSRLSNGPCRMLSLLEKSAIIRPEPG